MTTTDFKYSLDKGSKKFYCPGCGQKRFVRYINTETTEYLHESTGRCDRESNCTYHYTPKQYFSDNNISFEDSESRFQFPNTKGVETWKHGNDKPVEYLPPHCWQSINKKYRPYNHFFSYLVSLFGEQIAGAVFDRYFIGTSKHIKGATIFFQVDEQARLRTGKIMGYNPETGKRLKDEANRTTWVHKVLNIDINFRQCFFGQHLLEEDKGKTVCITESEKSAIIASVYFPQFIWMATGGATGGCKWRENSVYKALQYRTVIFFPDYGYANRQAGKTCFQEWGERVGRISEVLKGNFKVSDLLEKSLQDQERNDQDLIDVIVKRDDKFNWAMNDFNYPIILDTDQLVKQILIY